MQQTNPKNTVLYTEALYVNQETRYIILGFAKFDPKMLKMNNHLYLEVHSYKKGSMRCKISYEVISKVFITAYTLSQFPFFTILTYPVLTKNSATDMGKTTLLRSTLENG
jgi:hypothetical protein